MFVDDSGVQPRVAEPHEVQGGGRARSTSSASGPPRGSSSRPRRSWSTTRATPPTGSRRTATVSGRSAWASPTSARSSCRWGSRTIRTRAARSPAPSWRSSTARATPARARRSPRTRRSGRSTATPRTRSPSSRSCGCTATPSQDIHESCPDVPPRGCAGVAPTGWWRWARQHGYRNAQATVLAPTGTIGFMMDCDTTGIEPDLALVKYKLLAGKGDGLMKIVNQTVPEALTRLGLHGRRAGRDRRLHRRARHDRGGAGAPRRAPAGLRLRVQA